MPAPTKPKQSTKNKPMPKPKKRRGKNAKPTEKKLFRKILDIISIICLALLGTLCIMAFI